MVGHNKNSRLPGVIGRYVPDYADRLRRWLDDTDAGVALAAARLIGDRGLVALADALLTRMDRAEDAVGATCALSLAEIPGTPYLSLGRLSAVRPSAISWLCC